MADIHALHATDPQLLERLIVGYTSSEVYQITRHESAERIRFELRLVSLAQPFVKRYPLLDADTIRRYETLAAQGHAFGALAGERCVGLALCEPQRWNSSLVVWEFHISPDCQRQGIGRALMAAVEAHGRTERMQCIVCETQNTNVPAICFYRALGFTVDGVDISLYASDDTARGEVAIFMKKRIAGADQELR